MRLTIVFALALLAASALPLRAQPVKQADLRVNGARIHYTIAGNGPVV